MIASVGTSLKSRNLPKMKTRYRTREVLSHFRCSRCDGWWSIAEAPDRCNWFCPWCGWSNHRDEERIIEGARLGLARERARRFILREGGTCGYCRSFESGTCKNPRSPRYGEWHPGESATTDEVGCELFDDLLEPSRKS